MLLYILHKMHVIKCCYVTFTTTKIKILKFQENYHTPSLKQGLEQSYKVTSCNEKCNFFILLQSITLIQVLFVGTGSPRPNLQYIIHCKIDESSKYMIYGIYSNILSKWTVKIFHIHTIPNQWIRRIEKDTKFITHFNLVQILVTLKSGFKLSVVLTG